MPIYQFVCEGCDNQFEKIVWKSATDPKSTETCPLCGQEAARGFETPSPFRWGRGGAYNG